MVEYISYNALFGKEYPRISRWDFAAVGTEDRGEMSAVKEKRKILSFNPYMFPKTRIT